MRQGIRKFKHEFNRMSSNKKRYRSLQKHLDSMPVGFPRTISGVELRILRSVYTPDEAVAALAMTYRLETVEEIEARAVQQELPVENMGALLRSMEKKGAVFAKERDGQWVYCLMPIIIGFFEMQMKALTPGLYLDTRQYMVEGMAMEYLTTETSQMRVIPVEKSVNPEKKIATYDEIRMILNKAEGKIGLAECICRKGKDFLGEPCQKTNRRETCLALNDFHDMYTRNGWAKSISLEEALSVVEQCEEEGLVIQPSNEKNPSFVCMCCSCCCGILDIFSVLPRVADHVVSNHAAVLDHEKCMGCGRCAERCQTNAIHMEGRKAILASERCIGCGLCVSTCKPGALSLLNKPSAWTPPDDIEALMEIIQEGKKGSLGRLSSALKGMAGFKV